MGVNPTGNYTTYITTWGADPLAQIQAMIANGTINSHTTIDIAFANFDWPVPNTNPPTIPGLPPNVMAELPQIISAIKGAGGAINLSIGGATYPMDGTSSSSNPSGAAASISAALSYYGFSGVDFDIEDIDTSAAFNAAAATLIQDVRQESPDAFISLTLPGQAWYRESLVQDVIGDINTFQPMQYCIWVPSDGTYVSQIESDLESYNSWGVPFSKMTLGLMPGWDSGVPGWGNNLTLADAKELSTWAVQHGLQGVMTWDADNDGAGVDGHTPYAYTQAIENILNPPTSPTNVQSLGATRGSRTFIPIDQEQSKPKSKDWPLN